MKIASICILSALATFPVTGLASEITYKCEFDTDSGWYSPSARYTVDRSAKTAIVEDRVVFYVHKAPIKIGYTSRKTGEVTRIYPSVGLSDEIQYFYRASGLSPAAMNPDDGELIAPEILDQAAINQAIADGLICDAKTLLGIQLLGLSWQAMVAEA